MESYDAIVIGVGAVGSATLNELARRGAKVLGLERHEPGHDRGSSHGQTRAIRLAYSEHPDYVPLLRRTFELWRELDGRHKAALYSECGVLEAGPAGGELVSGVLLSAEEHGLEVERMSASALRERLPGVHLPREMEALIEPVAGYLRVEEAIRAMAQEACGRGANLRTQTCVDSWEDRGGSFVVHSGAQSWQTSRLLLAQGAWSSASLLELGIQLEVVRKPQLWFRTASSDYLPEAGFMPFIVETLAGEIHYGFPQLDERGVKVAEHSRGAPVTDPSSLDRELHPQDLTAVTAFLSEHLPGISSDCVAHQVCMYTRSPDEHFIVERHPLHEGLVHAAGLSGHGFKFAPVLGEILADLALEQGTAHPIDFFSSARFDSASS